jgi:heme exporter protein CcmD
VTEFLVMGGYAAYVWSAYGITLLVLGISAWAARRRRLEALERARQRWAEASTPRQPTVRKVE